MINKAISKNFNLNEFLESQTATRKGFKEQYQPSDEVIDNIEQLVLKVLQPLRDLLPFGTMIVSSGYRCSRLNDSVGGKPNSQHLLGMAVDICYYEDGIKNNKKLFDTLVKSNIIFDQAIKEYGTELNPNWIHISYNTKGKNRKQKLVIS